MENNKVIIAAAGSGKTTFIINEALKQKNKVLITTYTQANEKEIYKKIIKINKFIPENITIQTWYSFLLQHGVKPYQGYLFNQSVNGLVLVNGQSAKFIKEEDTAKHYFTDKQKIYSDKISKFVIKCNEKSNGAVIDRLSRIYPNIFIDEVQDLSGYDLEILKLFFNSTSKILLVGDPRQGTYSTNDSSKNKKFKKSKIIYFFEDKSIKINTDTTSLTVNHRSIPAICDFSNKLYPEYPSTKSGNSKKSKHMGVFLIKNNKLEDYLKKYKPIQLRYDSKTKVNENYKTMNFGESKGLDFKRVIIYPTKSFIDWLKNNDSELAPTSRSKYYVAITRAIFSVGIVIDNDLNIDGIKIS